MTSMYHYEHVDRIHVLSDIHGNMLPVRNLVKRLKPNELIIQIGDFGFSDTYRKLWNIGSDKLLIIAGNHDEYPAYNNLPNELPKSGIIQFKHKRVFFAAGAACTPYDRSQRTEGLSWWPEEEMNWEECNTCLRLWDEYKETIDIVLSHECPINVGHAVLGETPYESQTNKLLYEMFKMYEPPRWEFGHYHKVWERQIGRTLFQCLNIDEVMEIYV